MFNDFKDEDKTVFEEEVNIPIMFLHNCLLLLTFLKICVRFFIFEQFIYLRVFFIFMHCLN